MTRRRFSRAALLQPLFVSGAPNSSPLVNCAVLRKTLPKVFLPLALLVWACTPGKAHAATQGTLNATSSGDVTITYVQGLNARISGFTDFALGDWSGSGPMSANGNLCVGRSGVGFFGAAGYRILAAGDGTSGDPNAFTLSNGTDQIFYNVWFNDAPGVTGRQPLTAGLQLTGQSSSGFSAIFNLIFGCAFFNANLSIEVPEAELATSVGTYTGTLTLMMIPD